MLVLHLLSNGDGGGVVSGSVEAPGAAEATIASRDTKGTLTHTVK